MEYEDRLTIRTPEGVDLQVTLAGLGSRFIAWLLDAVIKLILLAAIAVVAAIVGGDAATAVMALLFFLVLFGYDVLFEVLGGGRTPGKRRVGLRVTMEGGQAIGFRSSVIRNALRLVDGPAFGYLPSIIAIVVTRRNQRLGDLAAGTVVLRESRERRPAARRAGTAVGAQQVESWDVSAVTADDIALVRRFLDRRLELAPAARSRLAEQLAQGLRAKVTAPGVELAGEDFLEAVAAAKESRG